MAEENLLRIDVEKRTTRGRVCPHCGGKIIPSDRAVYQSTADPRGVSDLAMRAMWLRGNVGTREAGG